ncbi:tyrosine-protein phosphatase YVH1 [Magnaporthiopsis poae ATCC 64411]|uniref:protein-tyrosine-phosphatase n=1 Tax=Magnaporthiopsis poae (strain ATCC 64411 / 73-15) TaxID=644358 RepID=A0A0C4E0J9_MAGP6|nr:tyrosine-protein phosphatase YVH1 [Magnaporthiopsis poae ATCC 64411]
MALSRINGDENLYVSGVFALRKAQTLHDHAITHILSVIDYDLDKTHDLGGQFKHLSIDINDEEDADLLVHFPRIVRFIDAGLSPPPAGSEKEEEEAAAPTTCGGVLVHCAMGKSRSVTATLAYLLWKHPWRFNGGAAERHGFKCSCDAWVCPAFSLQRSKVDEVTVTVAAAASGRAPDPRAALGIRMPPSFRKENL